MGENPIINIIRDKNQFHESLPGILGDPTTPLPQVETFGIWEASTTETDLDWLRDGAPTGPTDRHRMMRFNLQIINTGLEPLDWGSAFRVPEHYALVQYGKGWYTPYLKDIAEVGLITPNDETIVRTKRLKALMIPYPTLWNVPSAWKPFHMTLDPGFVLMAPEALFGTVLDVTDIPSGDYKFVTTFDPNNWTGHKTTEEFDIRLDGFDVRKII